MSKYKCHLSEDKMINSKPIDIYVREFYDLQYYTRRRQTNKYIDYSVGIFSHVTTY